MVASSYFHHFYPLRSQEDLPALIASVSSLHEPARSRKDSLLGTEPLHFPPETFVVSLQLPYHLSVLALLAVVLHPHHHDFLRLHWPRMTVQVPTDAASCPLR